MIVCTLNVLYTKWGVQMNKQALKENLKRRHVGKIVEGWDITAEARSGNELTIINSLSALLNYFTLPTAKSFTLSRAILKKEFEQYYEGDAIVYITEDGIEFIIASNDIRGWPLESRVVLRYPFTISLLCDITQMLHLEQKKLKGLETPWI